MAITNRERVGKALELLRDGLAPFVEREAQATYGEQWRNTLAGKPAYPSIPKSEREGWDVHALLLLVEKEWRAIYGKTLGRFERSLVHELHDGRNRWAHQDAFTTDDAYRVLDSIHRLLTAIAAEEAAEVDRQRQELLRISFDSQARKKQRRVAQAALVEGRPREGFRPWRELVTPHPDVSSGHYQEAEFAADLGQVHRGEGSDEYRDPVQFYRRTHVTEGLHRLLVNALRRLAGDGGDPVVELQTNFGGGKTHSMLALYHLFSADRASDLVGIEPVLAEAAVEQVPRARIAVLVGTALSPGQTHQKPDGTVIHTLWGELAWQLGNYGLVAEADRHGVSPGSDALRALFRETSGEAGPCLVLIDEWLAHARQLAGKDGMPAGSLAANLSFAQALTEAARAVAGTLVVVTIPESEIEKGGEAGRDVLEHLKNVLGRMDSPWRPASAEESFEIVRRRLFEEIRDPEAFKARDAVARAFGELYRSQAQELPAACREAVYERRIRACYPIHPELFDRLFHDWSSLDRFQRTRGVLRLMAKVIHTLWERNDQSLLILPGFVPLDDPAVHEELTRYLEDPWRTVIDTDVDGTSSLPYRLDGDNPSLGRFSASRRVARTVFLGSAATFQTAHRGIEDTQVKLGCIQPGETPAVFGDALRRLTDQAHHLYVDGRRYWYSTQPSVARLAQDRAQQQREDVVHEAIAERLRAEQRQRGDFARVHACPSSPADVGDDREARLVILGPEAPHAGNGKPSPAREAAERYLTERGTGPRRYRNTLVFLAADARRLEELESAVRQHLAWKSILAERRELNLDAYSETQAKTKTEESDSTVDHRIRETYTWLLVPGQQEPTAEIAWQAVRVQGQDALAVRAARKLAQDELLLTGMAGSVLRLHLDRVPLWRGDRVETGQLAEDFAQYLYLPRLRDDSVLRDAIQEGVNRTNWNPDTFAYADRWDEAKGRYVGLEGGRIVSVQLGGGAVVVKPEAAATQRAAEQKVAAGSGKITGGGDLAGVGSAATGSPGGPPPPEEAVRERYSHFYAAKSIDPQRVARDVQQINDEVLQHFVALAEAGVDVTLDIRVDLPDDLPDTLVRTITENCRTLGFKTFEFEKE